MKIAEEIAKALCVDDMRYLGRCGTCEPERTAEEIIAAKLAPVRDILKQALYDSGAEGVDVACILTHVVKRIETAVALFEEDS